MQDAPPAGYVLDQSAKVYSEEGGEVETRRHSTRPSPAKRDRDGVNTIPKLIRQSKRETTPLSPSPSPRRSMISERE